jgi:hypothetical protein
MRSLKYIKGVVVATLLVLLGFPSPTLANQWAAQGYGYGNYGGNPNCPVYKQYESEEALEVEEAETAYNQKKKECREIEREDLRESQRDLEDALGDGAVTLEYIDGWLDGECVALPDSALNEKSIWEQNVRAVMNHILSLGLIDRAYAVNEPEDADRDQAAREAAEAQRRAEAAEAALAIKEAELQEAKKQPAPAPAPAPAPVAVEPADKPSPGVVTGQPGQSIPPSANPRLPSCPIKIADICRKVKPERGTYVNCQAAINAYKEARRDVEECRRELEVEKEAVRQAKRDLRDDRRDRRKNPENSDRDGYSVCVNCREFNHKGFWGSLVGGLAVDYMGYKFHGKAQDKAAEYAASIGHPYYPQPYGGFGAGLMTGNVFGAALGGAFGGSFACSGGAYGNMGPMGMAGPLGMGAAGMYGNNGGAFGNPYGYFGSPFGMGNPGMPGMGMWPGGGGSAYLGLGNPYGGGPGGLFGGIGGQFGMGGPFGGIGGFGNPFGGIGGPGMGLGLGGQIGGGLGMGIPCQCVTYPCPCAAGGIGGGIGAGAGLGLGGQYQMEYQLRMLEAQREYQETQFQKYQTVLSLQYELQTIMQRIQAVQSGVYFGGSLEGRIGVGSGSGAGGPGRGRIGP